MVHMLCVQAKKLSVLICFDLRFVCVFAWTISFWRILLLTCNDHACFLLEFMQNLHVFFIYNTLRDIIDLTLFKFSYDFASFDVAAAFNLFFLFCYNFSCVFL